MKDVIINWDQMIFDGKKRQLPDTNTLYTQVSLDQLGSWSLEFSFDETPRNQGCSTQGKIKFLFDEAPHKILVSGFEFDFLDGPNKIGHCRIL